MSYFKAKMHQIRFRRPRPRWGSSQHYPRTPNWIWGGPTSRGREGKGEGEGGGRKGRGKVASWLWGMEAPGRIVDRCTGSCLACYQTHKNYFETGEILNSCWLVQRNVSKVRTTVILVVKAKFSVMGSSKKVSTNKCDTDKQPEIAIPKPEVLISPKVWQISW